MVDFVGRIKNYSKFMPACVNAAEVINGEVLVKLICPSAATLISYTTATGVVSVDFDTGVEVPGVYGCAVTSNASIKIHGVDYLGQLMTETITVASGTVSGKKAFKKILKLEHISSASTAVPTVDITVIAAAPLGLPFINLASVTEIKNGVAASLGTTAAGAFATTQSATSADPRGTYVPSGSPAGGDVVELKYKTSNYTFTSSNKLVGGYFGVAQYTSLT